MSNLKEYVVVSAKDTYFELWLKSRYDKYIADAALNNTTPSYQLVHDFSKDSPYQGSAGADPNYNPISCEHKLPTGFSAWMFQSESQSNFPGTGHKVSYYVCANCGEIKVVGRREDDHGKVNYFNEIVHIVHADAIDAIIKQANFYNEEVKWGRVSAASPAGDGWVPSDTKK